MSDYPRDLLVKEDIIRDIEDMMDIRFINKTESAEALKQHDAEIRRQAIKEFVEPLNEIIQTLILFEIDTEEKKKEIVDSLYSLVKQMKGESNE